jgi:Uncharacterized protein conserved in bacteria (DUF2066)
MRAAGLSLSPRLQFRFRAALRWALVPVALLGLAGAPAVAQTSSVFSVREMTVDVTAATATAARDQAIRDGQKRALDLVLRRMTRRADRSKLPTIDDATAAAALDDFQVANERISSVRYLASMTFNFQPTEVRRLLRRVGVVYAETPSRPVVIAPVLARDSELRLWEDPNPWRDAWTNLPKRDGLLPLIVPLGDIEDIAALSASQATEGDAAALTAFAARHGGTDVFVLMAEVSEDTATGAPFAAIEVVRYGVNAGEVQRLRINGSPREPISGFLARTAAATADAIEDAWVEGTLLRFGAERQFAASVPVAELANWVDVRERLDQVAIVSQYRVLALRRDRVDLAVHVLGDDEALRQALATVDLELGPQGALGNSSRLIRRIGQTR